MSKVKRILEIENLSNRRSAELEKKIKNLKERNYDRIDNIAMSGDAPKDFIKAYLNEDAKINKRKYWKKYIAKVGRKWYPIESITEHMCNRFGVEIGLKMASPRLRLLDGQIRFLSKYFLKNGERLMHGAEIFSAYLNEAQSGFVDAIDEKGMSRDLITFQFIEESIKNVFPNQIEEIMNAFVKMIIFDALVGNKDRHFYNYGIIVHIKNRNVPKFSPIYDTARGFFWNESDENIVTKYYIGDRINESKLNKYIDRSVPKIGWEGQIIDNHFRLVECILNDSPNFVSIGKQVISSINLRKLKNVLQFEFSNLFSEKRYKLIERCLEIRCKTLLDIIEKV